MRVRVCVCERACVRVCVRDCSQVRKLEEAAAALRLERDNALEEVERNQTDLGSLEQQLATAKTLVQQKSATIDKLMREQARFELELKQAREVTAKEEHKLEVLQNEFSHMTRDFLGTTNKLEEEVDRLRALDFQRQSALADLALASKS